jgi:glycerol-3-phosphate acyltransferase PlsX
MLALMLTAVLTFATVCCHGDDYSQYVLGIKEPKVGLLNIGEEPSKGNDLAITTYQMLQENPR